MMRFLQTTAFAFSTALLGMDCSRASDGNDFLTPLAAPACERPPEIPDVSHQWDSLISGQSNLPQSLAQALQNGSREESLAMNPCNSIREHVASTVSAERHYRNAYEYYQGALVLLNHDDRPGIRRQVRDKMSVIYTAILGLNDMNCRYLTASSCNRTPLTE